MILELDSANRFEPDTDAGQAKDSAFRPGTIASLLLHGLLLLLLIYTLNAPLPADTDTEIVPVDVVELAQTSSPAQGAGTAAAPQQRTAALQRRAQQAPRRAPSNPVPPVGVAPNKAPPPPDELDAKLEKLAQLRLPETAPILADGYGTSDRGGAGNGGNGRGRYSVADLVRMQVERRWNLDLAELGGRNIVVAVHVVMKGDGTVTEVDIIDNRRYNTDAKFRSIAISARNAVRLSSPIALPAGTYDDRLDMTLMLNPRNAMR